MKKVYIFALLNFLIGFTLVDGDWWLYPEINCNKYAAYANSCNQCFEWWKLYNGTSYARLWIYDEFKNNSSNKVVYYNNENTITYNVHVYNNTQVYVSNNLFKYPDSFTWFTSRSNWLYHVFNPNSNERFLEAKDWYWIRLDNVGSLTNPSLPAVRLDFISNFHEFIWWSVWPLKTHKECVFYTPSWCWDWITSDWESCDNWTSNWTAWNLCNTSCQVITPNCWNWVIEWAEKCDNGTSNGTPWNSCSATCQTNNNNSSWNWLGTTTSGAWEWNVPTNSTNWWNF